MSSTSPGEPDYWKGLFKVGGLLMILSVILMIVDLLVGIFIGGEPFGSLTTEQLLQYITAHRALYIFDETLLALAPIPQLASGPALVLALYFSLKEVNRKYVYYLVFSLGLTLTGGVLFFAAANAPLALVPLADKYAAATTDAQRAIFVTAAEAINALDNDYIPFIVSSLGLIILNIPMRKSVFGKPVSYLGIATGIVGLVPIIIVSVILSLIWTVWVGYKLYRLSRYDFASKKLPGNTS